MKPATLLLTLCITQSLATAEPLGMATHGRIGLKAPDGKPPLTNILVSSGSATPAPWITDPAARKRHTDILFPIHWWKWSGMKVEFTPAHDGTVELSLTGPWSAGPDGKPIRQEVLWDDLHASGTEILNGGFEKQNEAGPASWKSQWAPYPRPQSWPFTGASPLKGTQLAASWQNRPLSQQLKVRAGKKVTLEFHCKAACPPDFKAPARLGNATPAHRALARLKRGVNLGNCWEARAPGDWGIRFTPEDIDHIATQGFDHIRVPVAWHFHLKQEAGEWKISPALLADLEPVLKRALHHKLTILLDWHHFQELTRDPDNHRHRFVNGWKTITSHFKSWPPELYFELLNEPCEALTPKIANDIYQKTVSTIRPIDPERILVISPNRWGNPEELGNLRLPDGDERIIVTVHSYSPFQFTHQGAAWAGLQKLKGIRYPGPPDTPFKVPESLQNNSGVRSFIEGYNTRPTATNPSSPLGVKQALDLAREWSDHFGRPVHLGEFGAYDTADTASRARYIKDVRTLAEARGIPWTLWEWKAGFGYWDPNTKRPRFRDSLFDPTPEK